MAERRLSARYEFLEICAPIARRVVSRFEIGRVFCFRAGRWKFAKSVEMGSDLSADGWLADFGDGRRGQFFLRTIKPLLEIPDHVASGLDASRTRCTCAQEPHDLGAAKLKQAQECWCVEWLNRRHVRRTVARGLRREGRQDVCVTGNSETDDHLLPISTSDSPWLSRRLWENLQPGAELMYAAVVETAAANRGPYAAWRGGEKVWRRAHQYRSPRISRRLMICFGRPSPVGCQNLGQ